MQGPSQDRFVFGVEPDAQRLGDDQPEPERDPLRLFGLALDRAHHLVGPDPAVKIGLPGWIHPVNSAT